MPLEVSHALIVSVVDIKIKSKLELALELVRVDGMVDVTTFEV